MSNKAERAEEAIELYKQAATNYKLAKRWDDSARAYIECVECDKLCKGGQAADFYTEAANVKEKVNTAECVQFLEAAIQLYIKGNRVSNVAKTQKRIAEIYEKDQEYVLSSKNYQQAADNFSLEQNQSASMNTCLLKIVDIGILMAAPDYALMIKVPPLFTQILEDVAARYMQSKLTAPSAKELYFKAILLFLANDDCIGAGHAMQKYLNADPTFFQTRQQKFAQAMITAVKEQDLPLFSNEWYLFPYSATSSTRSSPSTSGRPPYSPQSRDSFPKSPAPPRLALAPSRPKTRSPNCDLITSPPRLSLLTLLQAMEANNYIMASPQGKLVTISPDRRSAPDNNAKILSTAAERLPVYYLPRNTPPSSPSQQINRVLFSSAYPVRTSESPPVPPRQVLAHSPPPSTVTRVQRTRTHSSPENDECRLILKQLSSKVKGLIKENSDLRGWEHTGEVSNLKDQNSRIQNTIDQYKQTETAREEVLEQENTYLRSYIANQSSSRRAKPYTPAVQTDKSHIVI